jgi:hypothetical protein
MVIRIAEACRMFILGEKIFIDVVGKNFIYNSIAQSKGSCEEVSRG